MDASAVRVAAVAVFGAVSLAGAGLAGVRMCDPQLPTGRAVALSLMAFLLLILGIACIIFTWWFWRFTLQLTF
ncbi:MAG: hypothetical protein ACR2HM_09675 [Acidimicrobiales bacterium]